MLKNALIDSFNNNKNLILFSSENINYSYGEFFSLVSKISNYFSKYNRCYFNIIIKDKINFFAAYLSIILTDNIAVFADQNNLINCVEIINDIKFNSILQECFEKTEFKLEKELDEDNVSTIIFTSGTTLEKKGVMLTNNNLYAAVNGGWKILKSNQKCSYLSILPIYHIFGLIADYFLPIFGGSKVYVNNDVNRMFDSFTIANPTCINLTPLLLEKLFIFLEQYGIENLNLKTILVGGAQISKRLTNKVLKKNLQLFNGYGSTETAGCIGITLIDNVSKLNVISLIEGVNITINKENEITVEGKNVMKGYYPNFLTQPSFSSNDLGMLTNDKKILLLGRSDTLIVLPNGLKVFPEQIENVVNEFDGVKGSLLFLKNDKLFLKIDSISRLNVQQLSIIPNFNLITQIIYGDLIYSEAHKVQRNDVKNELFTEIKTLIEKYINVEVLYISDLKYDLNITSVDFFLIIVEIEKKYNITFSDKDFEKMDKVQHIVELVNNYLTKETSLMFKKGIIVDLSDRFTVIDISLDNISKLCIELIKPHNSYIKGVIYGSSTCSRFIDAIDVEKLIKKYISAKEKNLLTYFIVPNVREEYFQKFVQVIDQLLERKVIDYLIVNDYGIMELYSKKVNIILGRLFDKRIRDFRTKNIFLTNEGIGVFSSENLKYYEEHNIRIVTLEPHITEHFILPQSLNKIYINYPYILEACGNICEFSGINKKCASKFKNVNCSFECLKYCSTTNYNQIKVYKYMNALYYQGKLDKKLIDLLKNDDFEIILKYIEG